MGIVSDETGSAVSESSTQAEQAGSAVSIARILIGLWLSPTHFGSFGAQDQSETLQFRLCNIADLALHAAR
jgi:hypothetical protein